eukprot:UN00670
MDLSTIRNKAKSGKYADGWDFAEDMRLVWENAKTYNRPGSGIFLGAEQLQDFWVEKIQRHTEKGNKTEESRYSTRGR